MPTYKDEKTGLWYCKFVYTDWTGTKKQKKKKGFRLQKEAKQYELDFLSKTSNSCDMLFSDMVEIYMDDCKARIRPTTYKGKEDIIAVHIMPYFKNLKVNEIQPMNVRRWQTELMNNQKNYKPTYLRTLNSQLSAIFNFAVKYYGLGSNPVQKSGTIGKKNSGLEQIWTADEFKIFIDAVSDKLQSKVIFNLLYWTGMRSGDDDDKIRLNQRKPSKYKGLRRFGPEKNLQRINKFMKERPIFYKNLIQMKENIRFYLRCFYCITKVLILQFNSENRTELARNG